MMDSEQQQISTVVEKIGWGGLGALTSTYTIWAAMASFGSGEVDVEDEVDLLLDQFVEVHYQIIECSVRIAEREIDAAAYEQVIGGTLRWLPTGGREEQPFRRQKP